MLVSASACQEDIQYLTHTLNNKERHTHEKYDTLMADAHNSEVSDTWRTSQTQANTCQKGNSDNIVVVDAKEQY
jgi:hypothetical protein